MAAFNFQRRKTRRWWYAGATLVAAAFLSAFFVVGAGATIANTTFNAADANFVQEPSPAATNADWCNQTQAQLNTIAAPNTGVCPTANLAPNFTKKVDLASGSTDDAFGQGSKEDVACPTEVFGSIPPNKSDLTRFYTAHEKVNGSTFLYLAWERTNILGNANMDFEFNQSKTACSNEPSGSAVPVRTNGDLLITYDFGGSGQPALNLLFWLAGGTAKDPVSGNTETAGQCFSANSLPCWGDRTGLNAGTTESEGSVNAANVVDPIGPSAPRTLTGSSSGGTIGEASINLGLALPSVFGANPTTCESFGSAYLKSRSSSSFTAEMKDFISPGSVSLNNCGSLLIHKTDGTNGLAGATFTAEPGKTTSTGTATSSTFVDENTVNSAYAGYYCLDNMLVGQSTTVTETQAPSGYNVDPTAQTITVSSTDSCATRLAATHITADGTDFVDTPQLGAIVITKTGKYKGCSSKTAGSAITVSSTQIGICGSSSDLTTAKLGGAGFQLKDSSGTVKYTSSGTTDPTTGTVCISGVVPGTYTVHESTTPSGYAGGSDVTGVTVSGNTTCTGTGTSAPATATVLNQPLTTITVSTTPQVGNSTSSTAYCVATTGGSSTGDTSGSTTPYTTSNAVTPGTYTCTVVVDP